MSSTGPTILTWVGITRWWELALITDESTLAFADVLLGSLRNTCPPIRARIRVTRVVFRLTVRSGKDAFACAVVKIVFELVARTTVLA